MNNRTMPVARQPTSLSITDHHPASNDAGFLLDIVHEGG